MYWKHLSEHYILIYIFQPILIFFPFSTCLGTLMKNKERELKNLHTCVQHNIIIIIRVLLLFSSWHKYVANSPLLFIIINGTACLTKYLFSIKFRTTHMLHTQKHIVHLYLEHDYDEHAWYKRLLGTMSM